MLFLGNWLVSILAVLFCLVSVLMMLLILVQKPKGGGLAGAFGGGGGGGGGGQGAFGAKVGDVLTWATVVFFVAFLLLAMGLTWTIRPDQEQRRQVATEPARAPATAPIEPVEPMDPVEPVEPVTPAAPVEPTAPMEPTTPPTTPPADADAIPPTE
jgi:preprotein translocase subunit SecG